MINGDPNEFIDRIYTGQDTVYKYDHIKYWFQGYVSNGLVHMEVFQYEPPKEEYIWEYTGTTFAQGQEAFQTAAIFNGMSFWEVEAEIEWVDE